MKFSTLFATKRARVIAISVAAMVLVLAILTPILLYAGGYIMPFDADGQPSERLLNRIKWDLSIHWASLTHSFPKAVGIEYCGAYYNGCVPFLISGAAMDVLTEETIGGVLFVYADSNTLIVWKSGKFYELEEAYENGWLNQDDLLKIRDDLYAYKQGER